MPILSQIATVDDPPSYVMLDDEVTYIDYDILDTYGDWIVTDSWKDDYTGFEIFAIVPPTTK